MNDKPTEFERQLQQTLEHSLEQLDDNTVDQLQQARQQALLSATANDQFWLRPAMMLAASLVALAVVPWLYLQQDNVGPTTVATVTDPGVNPPPESQDYLQEDPDMLANWEMLAVLGETPDA